MSNFVYDAAVLISAERNQRETWTDHKARLDTGRALVPAPVVAQVSRSSKQAQLRRFLAGCTIVPLDARDAHEAGRLLGITRTTDVVDAVVVAVAMRYRAVILTGDTQDILRLAQACGGKLSVVGI
ncbi:MAG: PIN domain-containing protein [Bryobacteraceae bacterium]